MAVDKKNIKKFSFSKKKDCPSFSLGNYDFNPIPALPGKIYLETMSYIQSERPDLNQAVNTLFSAVLPEAQFNIWEDILNNKEGEIVELDEIMLIFNWLMTEYGKANLDK